MVEGGVMIIGYINPYELGGMGENSVRLHVTRMNPTTFLRNIWKVMDGR